MLHGRQREFTAASSSKTSNAGYSNERRKLYFDRNQGDLRTIIPPPQPSLREDDHFRTSCIAEEGREDASNCTCWLPECICQSGLRHLLFVATSIVTCVNATDTSEENRRNSRCETASAVVHDAKRVGIARAHLLLWLAPIAVFVLSSHCPSLQNDHTSDAAIHVSLQKFPASRRRIAQIF
jgi:hypothetical protein